MKNYAPYLIVSLLLTLYLGYLDEGYYNFNFLRSIGNIIVLLVYCLVFVLLQIGLDKLLKLALPKLHDTTRQATTIGLGLFIPIFVFIILPHLH